MELEYVNLTLSKSDLRSIKKFVREGIIHSVKTAFDLEQPFEEWVEMNNDELETLSSICNLYNTTNFHEYAEGKYKLLQNEKE